MTISDLNIPMDKTLNELKNGDMRLNREPVVAFKAGFYTAQVNLNKSYLARGAKGAISYTISIEALGEKGAKKKFLLNNDSFVNYIKNDGSLNIIGAKPLNQLAMAQGLEDLYSIEFEESKTQFKGGQSTRYNLTNLGSKFLAGLREVEFYKTQDDLKDSDKLPEYIGNEIEILLPFAKNILPALAEKIEEAKQEFDDRIKNNGPIKRIIKKSEDNDNSSKDSANEDTKKKEAEDLAKALL